MKIQIARILCPVDFSESSEHALHYAFAFAETYQAELILMHVMDYAALDVPDFPSAVEFSADTIQQIREVCEKRLQEVVAREQAKSIRVSSRLVSGTPAYEIVQAARDETADLIIIGTHGRTGLSRVLMGSVTEKVIRKAPCPVLTVKVPQHEFVKP